MIRGIYQPSHRIGLSNEGETAVQFYLFIFKIFSYQLDYTYLFHVNRNCKELHEWQKCYTMSCFDMKYKFGCNS